VVSEGGGKNASIAGYRIGGKTGTAQLYKDGKIVKNVHIGSFLGFAPADNPRFMVLVTVSEAKVPIDYGGTTAAPFARQILNEMFSYYGIKAEGEETDTPVTVPAVVGQTLPQARKTLAALGFLVDDDGKTDMVSAQLPAGGATLQKGGRVMLYTYEEEPSDADDMVLVPDVNGMSIVEASRTLRARYLSMEMSGTGLAVRQTPAANTYTAAGGVVQVTFELPKSMGE
jgi:stage V sporulation protein D (sporulation-specific penicillin-binding protein)